MTDTILFAQPYDITSCGFYFRDAEEYAAKSRALRNEAGQPVEEFEIQFIDGEAIDAALSEAWGLNQVNFARFLEVVDEWEDYEKRAFIIGVGECGLAFDTKTDDPGQLDIDLYEVDNLRDLAEMGVEEGWFGPIPDALQCYIDYAAIARDLAVDFTEIAIAGGRYVYACR